MLRLPKPLQGGSQGKIYKNSKRDWPVLRAANLLESVKAEAASVEDKQGSVFEGPAYESVGGVGARCWRAIPSTATRNITANIPLKIPAAGGLTMSGSGSHRGAFRWGLLLEKRVQRITSVQCMR